VVSIRARGGDGMGDNTFGPAYDENLDGDRLRKQHNAVKNLMLDGKWRTLREISQALDYPESSISAQLRHLRKVRFGCYTVLKQRRYLMGERSAGTWEYKVLEPKVARV
jgi:hypothetical protein